MIVPGRRDAAADDARGRGQGADDRRALRARARSRSRRRPTSAAAPAASPGGGCQFLGTAATAQVVAEALGLTLPHSALAPSGQPIWLDMARRSALALLRHARARDRRSRDVLTPGASRTRCSLHAAFGGSTNLLLHIPAIAHAAGLRRPTVDDWQPRQPRRAAARRRAAERPAQPPDGAGVPGRRRARGDAAPARAWACSTLRCGR